jgi:ubiquinone/menaquinone biosynthesis C-methylase UbiE
MEDVYLTIGDAEEAVQERLADLLELRAADARQREMLDEYLGDLRLAPGARVLEIGCGTGAVARRIAKLFDGTQVVGVDPSPVFVERAGRLAGGDRQLSFVVGDGRELPFEDGAFDAVVCHTSLCHIPGPERVLDEAARVARPGGQLAVFDGDYATATVATSPADPLQACVEAAVSTLVYDRYFVRGLSALVQSAGWEPARTRSLGYVQTAEPVYMLALIDRGADALASAGRIAPATAEALKAEARRRAQGGTFFGHIAYLSLVAVRS